MHTLIHTPKGNLELPINLTGMSLDCGRKPEYPVRTHACTGRTCKLHAERPLAGNRYSICKKTYCILNAVFLISVCVRVVVSGGATRAGGLPGVQAGFAQRVQAAGRAAAGAGASSDQDRRQQDTENIRFPH
ncbi:hypothetical protein XENORESO_013297 [Xenotaenia resolanae]|uniref:Uncharacterized protein n=1 Tax=Xenotaenia resolanae TaxID=208358 RepID=A0ABV0W8E6_9TELE